MEKVSEKLLKQFNRPDTHLVISGYPVRDGHTNNYGISWYTKETIEPLAKKKKARFIVLAETNGHNEPKVYQDGHILVLRVFDQRHLTVYPYILKWLHKFNNVKNVYVHSEFAANGGVKNFAFLAPFLALIKLTGRNITFFSHNFVESFDKIAGHLNFEKGSTKLAIFNVLLSMYNHVLTRVVDRIVVMDEAIKKRVENYISKDRIVSFPISIKRPQKKVTKSVARNKLNIKKDEKVLLFFGFVTWYKGADWIIGKVSNYLKRHPRSKIRLIIAGGEAYSLKEKDYYQKYYKKQLEKASKDSRIIITGFLPESEIGTYFAAADMVVYPYRGLIGASGALTYALAYDKPVMLSPGLAAILQADDCQHALKRSSLMEDDISFTLSQKGFNKIINTIQDTALLNKMNQFSKKLADAREYAVVLDSYYQYIYDSKVVANPLVSISEVASFVVQKVTNFSTKLKTQYAFPTIKNTK